mmetsp:Transcript_65363/g.123753  ORF Transcript_65363/g.123753 Transcript_65363/m.123753 type:complete len:417 (-) Transcript_65363:75-1325(-)
MSSFMSEREGGTLPKAISISNAGSEEANGVYKATGREYCDAPVYEHMEKGAVLKITREPHKNAKTGAIKHGWLLGHKKTPLYGAPTESLVVPSSGWKKFSGVAPSPTVKVHAQLVDIFYDEADAAKTSGDSEIEKEDWSAAEAAFTKGIDSLKRSGERFGDAFKSRAAVLLARRATIYMKMEEPRVAIRDATAALELIRGLASAEAVFTDAAKALGCTNDAMVQKLLEPIGNGRILDSGCPLVLRCVERWIEDAIDLVQEDINANLPAATHYPADKYLDGLTEEQRAEVIKRFLPQLAPQPDGGTAVIQNAREALNVMKQMEEVCKGQDFNTLRKQLWERQGSYPRRLEDHRDLMARVWQPVLEPVGYAVGRPGLTRCVRQLQHFWSTDKACARKALDLEELADISLADLDDSPGP